MLPTEDLFVYVYVLIHDLMRGGSIAVPPRPGPAPACSDAELLAIAVVRHLLGRRSAAAACSMALSPAAERAGRCAFAGPPGSAGRAGRPPVAVRGRLELRDPTRTTTSTPSKRLLRGRI
jgi:hypothetical protein